MADTITTFETALAALRDGHSVRRAAWAAGITAKLSDSHSVDSDPMLVMADAGPPVKHLGQTFVQVIDVLAADWSVVVE